MSVCCAEPGCGVTRFCTQCTLCLRVRAQGTGKERRSAGEEKRAGDGFELTVLPLSVCLALSLSRSVPLVCRLCHWDRPAGHCDSLVTLCPRGRLSRHCDVCSCLCLTLAQAYCTEHIPLENHTCAAGSTAVANASAVSSTAATQPASAASAGGSAPGTQRIDSGGSASGGVGGGVIGIGGGVGGATRGSSGGSYDRLRPRSRDSPLRISSTGTGGGGVAGSSQPSLGGVLSSGLGGSGSVSGLGLGLGLGLHGSSGGSSTGGEPHDLASPEYVKRLSSSSPLSLTGLLRRTSSLPGGRSLGGVGSQSQNGLLPPSYNRTPSGLGMLGSPGALGNGGHGGTGGGVSGSLPRGLSAMFASPSHSGLGEHGVSGSSNGSNPGGALEYSRLDSLMRGGSIPPQDASLLLHQHAATNESSLHRKPLDHSASSRLPRLRSRDGQAPQSTTDLFAVMRGQESQQHTLHQPQQQHQQFIPEQPSILPATTPATAAASSSNKRKDASALDSSPSVDHAPTPRGKKAKLAQQQLQQQQQDQHQPAQLAVPVKAEPASASRRSPQATKRQLAAAAAAASAPPPPPSVSYATAAPAHYSPMLLSPAAQAASQNPTDPRAMGLAYENEYQRMEQLVNLLTAWPLGSPSPSNAAAASGASAPSLPAMVAADEIVKVFQRESLLFQREQTLIADGGNTAVTSPTAAGAAAAASSGDSPSSAGSAAALAVALASHRRLRICESIVQLSFTAPERLGAEASAVPGVVSALQPFVLPPPSRIPLSFHPLLPLISRALCLLSNAMMLGELEMAVWSLYLDRLLGDWVSRTDLRTCGGEGCNLRLLHYCAYMVKLSFTDTAGGPTDPLLAYLTGLYPDFLAHFTSWMHSQGSTTLATPPLLLNQRFRVITAQAGNGGPSTPRT